MDAERLRRNSGQSVIEFCIGLVALLTVIAGVFQLGTMGLGRTRARVEATAQAAVLSMSDPDDTFRWVRSYVREVSSGPDGRPYSMDDEQIVMGAEEVYTRILQQNQPSVLSSYAPNNDLANLYSADQMQAFTGLVPGSATEAGIPVMPIVRRLFFDQPSIDVDMQVWSVHTGGLY